MLQIIAFFKTTNVPMVLFTLDKTGTTESSIAGITGFYSEKPNLKRWFLLSYTKQSGFTVAHHPVLVSYCFLLHYATD